MRGATKSVSRRGRSANPEFDPEGTRFWLRLVRETIGRYFRFEVLGCENLPRGRCMVVGCHGGVMPYDAALALVAIERCTGRLARAVGDQFWGKLGPLYDFLRRRGAVVGDRDVAVELLREGNILLVMPGGALDMTRPYWKHPYRVLPHKGFAPGHGGYIKVALRAGAPIVPMAVVGAEEAHVLLANLSPLARLLRVPFFPVVAFPFPLPVKIYVRFGPPIRLRGGARAARDQRTVDRYNEEVRRALQDLIDDTLERRRGIVFSRYVGDERGPAGQGAGHGGGPGARKGGR
ncbi:MAG: hypothetical protein KatS3mg076_0413 [Candidatus Binatia bacterium]|nr:MAG: hypothetical protein KatS3mg076_0413 [Candidatus Binatia bacterium]